MKLKSEFRLGMSCFNFYLLRKISGLVQTRSSFLQSSLNTGRCLETGPLNSFFVAALKVNKRTNQFFLSPRFNFIFDADNDDN